MFCALASRASWPRPETIANVGRDYVRGLDVMGHIFARKQLPAQLAIMYVLTFMLDFPGSLSESSSVWCR